jgi:hypothetical protein
MSAINKKISGFKQMVGDQITFKTLLSWNKELCFPRSTTQQWPMADGIYNAMIDLNGELVFVHNVARLYFVH